METDGNVLDSTALPQNDQIEEPTTDQVTEVSEVTEVSKPKTSSKRAKRLAAKSIEHGTEIDPNLLPHSKYLSSSSTF